MVAQNLFCDYRASYRWHLNFNVAPSAANVSVSNLKPRGKKLTARASELAMKKGF